MSSGKFYITTPIYYVNDKPHIGHAYTTIVADTLARWRAAQDEDVLFLTGTDEFAQKTVDAAKKNGEEIGPYTDRMAGLYQTTWQKLDISNTDFIRTTEERHITTVKDFWERLEAAGDLYRDRYEGLYCKGHEAFMKEDELTPDGLCPEHKTKPELVSEENYFFRLSHYQNQLLEYYDTHTDFVVPVNRFREVRSFVESGLEDISFSRERKPWGIPVPNDPNQVIYVWADALVNYISAIGLEGWEEHPADIHLMAKDIVRFHAVIWPAMLMSAGLPLPGQVVAHGFFTNNGVKMSKTIGNVVDPLAIVDKYGADALRYFLLREVPFGEDGDFSEEKMRERYNADLANGLGNFAARVLTMASGEGDLPGGGSSGGGKIGPDFETIIAGMRKAVRDNLNKFKFNDALVGVWQAIAYGDQYINEKKVWAIEDAGERKTALVNLVTLLGAVATELIPFMPETSKKITAAIENDGDKIKTKKIGVLFPRIK